MTASLPRVLFFNQAGVYGGAERSLYDLAVNYPGKHRVVLMQAGPLYDDLIASGIDAVVLGTNFHKAQRAGLVGLTLSFWTVILAAVGLVRMCRGYDVVYANSMKAAVVAALSKPLHRRKVVWHLRSLLVPEHFSPVTQLVARWCGNWGVDLVIANSNATAEAYQRNGGKHRPLKVYNGFAVDRFLPAKRQELRDLLVAEHGLDPNRPIIGMIGRIGPWKGQVPALMGLSMGTKWQIMVVGGALFESEKYRRDFRKQAAEIAEGGNIFFLGHRDDIAEIMGGVDVVIHTATRPEPFGRVIVEAMLSGTPVIATHGGGVPEILEHGVTGLLVEPGSPPALRAAIEAVLRDKEQSARMAVAARDYAERNFALEETLPQNWLALKSLATETQDRKTAPADYTGAEV